MVSRTDGKLKYHWSIRSPEYSGLIETTSFEKIWDVIGELPAEGVDGSSHMHKKAEAVGGNRQEHPK
jgi:hypothetical protein